MFVVRRRGDRSLERLQYEMEDVFNAMIAGRPLRVRQSNGQAPAWRPPIEVYETERELVVLVELAGMQENDIEVVIDESVMTIRGERQPVGCEDRRSTHLMGIMYGPFAADVYLPITVDHDRIEATYEAGLLRVRLPRSAATRIQIGAAS